MKKLASLLVVGLCLALSQGSSVAARCHNSTKTSSAREIIHCSRSAITVILSQELTNEGNKLVRKYFGDVQFGDQGVQLRFDTTARDIWLPEGTHECRTWLGCVKIGAGSITVSDGKRIEGTVYEDNVQLCGNAKTTKECQPWNEKITFDHRFLSAKVQGKEGVFGLASDDSNELGGPTYLQALRRTLLPAKVALYLNKNLDSGAGGELVIGCKDEKRFRGESEKYHQLVDNGSNGWKVRLNKVELGRQDVTSSSKSALLDTGRDRMRAPQADFEKICQKLEARQDGESWTVDCQKRSTSMSFKIDDEVYPIDSTSFLIERQGKCQLNIESWDKDMWSLGTSFLRSRYTIFDLDKRRVGFAEPNHN